VALKFYQPKMQSLFGVSNSEGAARRSAATGMRLFKVRYDAELPAAPDHPFYKRLNEVLDKACDLTHLHIALAKGGLESCQCLIELSNDVHK
jgi:hypothetical protein